MEMNNNNKPQATKADVMNRQQLIKRIVVASWEKDLSQEFAEAYKQVADQLNELEESRNWYCQTFEHNGKVGLTDCSGTEVLIPAIYDSIPFLWHNDRRWLTPVELNGRFGFAEPDGKGTLTVPCQFCKVKLIENGFFFLVKLEEDGKWGVINRIGNLVLPCCADEVQLCNDCNIAYRVGDKWGWTRHNGSLLIEALYDDVNLEDLGKPYTFVKDGVKGYVTQDGKFISEADYDALPDEEQDAHNIICGIF